jgi:hypothetical protein
MTLDMFRQTPKEERELYQGVIDNINTKRSERKAILDKMPEGDEKEIVKHMESAMRVQEDGGIKAMQEGIDLIDSMSREK